MGRSWACGMIARKGFWSCRRRCARSGTIADAAAHSNILIDLLRGEPIALAWLETFPRLPIDDAIALGTAHCSDLNLATRNSRDFPLMLGGVVHPYAL